MEVDAIYFDFAKAFYKIDHQVLLGKLERYGISGHALFWLLEFLHCSIESRRWLSRLVKRGEPQGTV